MSVLVAVTGLGIVSCPGIGVEAAGQALRAGKSGVAPDGGRAALHAGV